MNKYQKIIQDKKDSFYNDDCIQTMLLDWAVNLSIGDIKTEDDFMVVVLNLESCNCCAGSSPAPIYYTDMAREFAEFWQDIDEARQEYLEEIGEPFTLTPESSVLNYLWFTYEWEAHKLANDLRWTYENLTEKD